MGKNIHLKRESYYKCLYDYKKNNLQLGFNYKNNIMKKTLSNFLFLDKKRERFLNQLDILFYELIENVKNIKKTFNYAINKDNYDLN